MLTIKTHNQLSQQDAASVAAAGRYECQGLATMKCHILFVLLLQLPSIVFAQAHTIKEWRNGVTESCEISLPYKNIEPLIPGWSGDGEPRISIGQASSIAKTWAKEVSGHNAQIFLSELRFYSYRDIGMKSNLWLYEAHLSVFEKNNESSPIDKYLVVLLNGDIVSETCRSKS